MTPAQLAIARALKAAADGVEFRSGRGGAYCPVCGAKLRTVVTRPPADGYRIRYHKCLATDCVLSHLGKSVKSVETLARTPKKSNHKHSTGLFS